MKRVMVFLFGDKVRNFFTALFCVILSAVDEFAYRDFEGAFNWLVVTVFWLCLAFVVEAVE